MSIFDSMPADWWWSDAPPTWLAFLGAGVAVFFTYKAHRRDRGRDLQEQASHVAVWPNKAELDSPEFGLINSSSAPVWSVVVYAYEWADGRGTHKEFGKFDVGATPPLGTPRYFTTGLPAVDYEKQGYLYAMSFRDSSNNYWHRTARGELKRGKHPEEGKFGWMTWPDPPGHGAKR